MFICSRIESFDAGMNGNHHSGSEMGLGYEFDVRMVNHGRNLSQKHHGI